MTIYLTFSALDSGRLSLGDGLPVSINALNAPPTKMGLPPGGTVSVRDATMALVTRSANDAAVVLAEALGGDEATFAQMMTSKARQLGMSQTVFRNASGLPNREQVTTARDMARLAFALMRDFPHYYPVFSVQSWPYRGRSLENHNRMLGSYEGADGLKTGYTNASGFNLVMSAMRDNRRLIGVVMGGDSAGQRDRMMAMLMDQGFASAATMRLSPWTNDPQAAVGALYRGQFRSQPDHSREHAAPGHGERVSRWPASRPPPPPPPPPATAGRRSASPAPPCRRQPKAASPPDGPPIGSWVIQVGSFSDSQAAQLALERASSTLVRHALGRRGRRRGADGQQDLPPRAAHQPFAGPGRRRLQAAGEEEDLLLGDPGHRLEYAERALERAAARLSARRSGNERPLVPAPPRRAGPTEPPLGCSRPRTGSNTDTVVSLPPIHTFSGAMR